MTTRLMACALGLFALSAAMPVTANTSQPATTTPAPPATISATIEAIDQTNRLVTLKGPKGNLVQLYADETYTNFAKLKVGDVVTATYYESVAAHVRRPGDPAPSAAEIGRTPRADGKPGATASIQETVSVVVQAVDKANSAVTIKKQNGDIVSMRVQNPKYLELAKAGETVDITYTRALLIKADPAPAKK